MKINRANGSLTLILSVAAALALLQGQAFGQTTYSWTGSAGNFSSGPSWNNGVAPPSNGSTSAILDFSPTGSLSYSATNDLPPGASASLPLGGFTFNGSSTGSVTIFTGSNNFQLGPSNYGIVQNGSTPVTFISTTGGTAAGSSIFNVTNDFTIGGSGTGTVTLGGATTNVVMTGSGNITVNFTTPGTSLNPNLLLGNIGVSGVDAFTGNLNISSGYVKANQTGGDLFGNLTVVNVSAGATMDMNNNGETFGGLAGNGNLVMGTAGLTYMAAGDRTWSGTIQGTGGVNQSATGTWSLGGTNTYTGTTTVALGTIRTISANSMSPNSIVSLNGTGNVLDLNGYNQTIAGLKDGAAVNLLTLGNATLTIAPTSSTALSFFGTMSGAGNLVKTGSGTQLLFGPSTYTGTTTVAGGYLRINASTLGMGSGVTISGGSLEIAGDTNYTPTAFSASANTGLITSGAGTTTLAGTVAFGGSTIAITGGGLTIDDTANNAVKLSASPALTLTSGTLALLGNGSANSAETVSGAESPRRRKDQRHEREQSECIAEPGGDFGRRRFHAERDAQ